MLTVNLEFTIATSTTSGSEFDLDMTMNGWEQIPGPSPRESPEYRVTSIEFNICLAFSDMLRPNSLWNRRVTAIGSGIHRIFPCTAQEGANVPIAIAIFRVFVPGRDPAYRNRSCYQMRRKCIFVGMSRYC